MGATVSVNSTDIITKALTDVSSEILLKNRNINEQLINVTFSDIDKDLIISNLTIFQKGKVNIQTLFNNLEKTENANRINEEIEKITKSSISGLNIAQISTSVSTLSNIIENCIKIKNKSISECQNVNKQNIEVPVERIKGTTIIQNIDITQITENFSSCILNNKNTNDLRLDTDMKIKQITSSKAEGLDMKWIAIAIAIAFSSFAVVSTSTISKLIGPIMVGIGSWLTWFSFKNNKKKTMNKTVYIKDNLNKILNFVPIVKIKEENISNNSLDVTSYGDASIYETFNNKIILYSGVTIENIEKINDNISSEDLEVKIISGGIIELGVKNSSKYPLKRLNYNIDNKYKNVQLIKDLNITESKDDTVYLLTENFEYTHQLKIYLTDNKTKKLNHVNTYFLEPTILSYNIDVNKSEIFKNSNTVIGISLIILGTVVTFTSFLKK